MKTAIKKWEVKTGKNKGLYIAVTPKQAEKFYPQWGGLIYDYNAGIYKYHGVKHTDIILTCSVWARHSMRKSWLNIN